MLTHHALEVEEDPSITFVLDNIRGVVARAINAAAGKNVLVIGADVARQCIQEGLIDEIIIHLAPISLGDGVRLFSSPGLVKAVRLKTEDVTRSGQLTNLKFRVL